MNLYEVELRVSYGRKVLIEASDEDAASENAAYAEDTHICGVPGSFRVDVGHYGIRVVEADEVER